MARLRAVEPQQLDREPISVFLPATILATTWRPITIAADLSMVNNYASRIHERGPHHPQYRAGARPARVCSRRSRATTGSRAVRAPTISRARCAPKCAMRCGCSASNGRWANSPATMPAPRRREDPYVRPAADREVPSRWAKPTQDFDPGDTAGDHRRATHRFGFHGGPGPLALDLRLQMGRRWLQMIPASARDAVVRVFHYKIVMPDPTKKDDAAICAHAEAMAAVPGRGWPRDGWRRALFTSEGAARRTSRRMTSSGCRLATRRAADTAGPRFVAWFDKLYSQPQKEEGDAWQPERLEYAFACSHRRTAPATRKCWRPRSTSMGRLDWYNFDWDTSRRTAWRYARCPSEAAEPPWTRSTARARFIPAPVRFNGMPDTRWWAFEDGKTNFGDIGPGPPIWRSCC